MISYLFCVATVVFVGVKAWNSIFGTTKKSKRRGSNTERGTINTNSKQEVTEDDEWVRDYINQGGKKKQKKTTKKAD